jgi:hypothetical protein
VTKVFDIDEIPGMGVEIQCLFKGEAAETYEEVAPYLVDMTLPEGAWDDADLVPEFHKDFFKNHWDGNEGIFVRSTASLGELKQHFRKFTQIQDEAGKWYWFRFWDPSILKGYFDHITGIAEKAIQWVNMQGEGRIEAIIGNHSNSSDAWNMSPVWGNLVGVKNRGKPTLSDVEFAGFARYRILRYEKRAMAFFRKQFPIVAQTLSDEQLLKVIQLAYDNAKKHGITTERNHFKYLIIVAYWGSLFDTDPQYVVSLENAGWNVKNEKPYAPYITSLIEDIGSYVADLNQDLFQPKRIILGFERIYTKPPETITYESVGVILQNIWPTRCNRLGTGGLYRFIGKTGEFAQKEFKLKGSDLITYIALAIYFGAEFGRDPIYPWANKALILADAEERRHKLGEHVFKYFQYHDFLKEIA